MTGFVGTWYLKRQIRLKGCYVENVNIADSFIGCMLSNPAFQTVFNTEETGIDVWFFAPQ